MRLYRAMDILSDDDIRTALDALPGWEHDGQAITKTYELSTYREAIGLIDQIADEAEQADHHPDIDSRYDKVKVSLSTHSAGGVTRKDIELASRIDALAQGTKEPERD